LQDLDTSLRSSLDDVVKRTAGFVPGDAAKLRAVEGLPAVVSDIRTKDIPNLAKNMSTQIAATNNALTGFREGTQGRSLRSRARELLGTERYQVTPESFDILQHLICGAGCSPSDAAIVTRLAALKGAKQMGKDAFRKHIGIRGGAPGSSPWEAVILRYTRVPY